MIVTYIVNIVVSIINEKINNEVYVECEIKLFSRDMINGNFETILIKIAILLSSLEG